MAADVTESAQLPGGLVEYFAARHKSHAEAVDRALRTLTPFERRLVREAAVMGFVRGAMEGRSRATLGEPRKGDIPSDGDILSEVVGACISMNDLYPYLAAASQGRRRRVTRARMWPGEKANTTRDQTDTTEGDPHA